MKTDQVICRTEFRFDEEAQAIEGYAAVFYDPADPGTEYKMGSWFVERLDPKAFNSAMKRKDDVRALFNHDPDQLLGRVSSGSLKLSKDERGLRYRIQIDPTDPDHQRVIAKIKRGDLDGSSFAFVPEKWRTEETGEVTIRTVLDLRLVDVSPVTFPAYTGTTSELRTATQEDLRRELTHEPPNETEPPVSASPAPTRDVSHDLPIGLENSVLEA